MLDISSPGLPPALAIPFGLIENAYRRLTTQTQSMTQEELEFAGPPGNVNTTATLIGHLAQVDLEYLHAIKGEPVPPDLAAQYGPYQDEQGRLPKVTGKSAADLLAHYGQVIELIHTYLTTQTDADAARPVTIPWWPQPATVRYVLWHMASHSIFHQGQISRLRARTHE